MHEQSPPQPPTSTPNGKVFQLLAGPAHIASVYNSDYNVGLLVSKRTEHFTSHGATGEGPTIKIQFTKILALDLVFYKLPSFTSTNDEQVWALHKHYTRFAKGNIMHI